MILKRIKVQTPFNEFTNCYIVEDDISKETIVIDPGGEVDKVMEMLNTLKSKVKYIYLTHCHGDHIGGANELKEKTKAKILIHRDDCEGLTNDQISLASYIGFEEVIVNDSSRVDDNDFIHIGNLRFKVIHTPGHTKGGSSLYCEQEKMVFTGDTMFRGTWGRTDLPTGSLEQIISSITKKLLTLPDDTIVYPGHGKSTMIKEERPIYEELKPRLD
ncbi:MAG: MBL fold metallo-hydrolase [Clostridia bacterium]|nr:MBL fold metallo-hydrolase [Clostridia bacterium]